MKRRTKIFVCFVPDSKPFVARCLYRPTGVHIGPFKTLRAADWFVDGGAKRCRTVHEAERMSLADANDRERRVLESQPDLAF